MMAVQKGVEGMETYSLSANYIKSDDNDSFDLDYTFNTDVIIIDNELESKVIISNAFEVSHATFQIEDIKTRFNVTGSVLGRDILRTMTFSEGVETFINAEIMENEDIFNIYTAWILELRREGEIDKIQASYLYYEIAEIASQLTAKMESSNPPVDFGTADWSLLIKASLMEISDLEYDDARSVGEVFNPKRLSAILEDVVANVRVIDVFKQLVWEPLQAELSANSRVLSKPTLKVIK